MFDINPRGRALLEFLSTTDLEILNQGNEPTFINSNRRKVIDITLGSFSVAPEVQNWQVSDEASMSDHRTADEIDLAVALLQEAITSSYEENCPEQQTKKYKGAPWWDHYGKSEEND
ncbi:hypothetical protein NQ317_012656 [Molorchus minor]|uniref:Endonuclease/exonuclease/phosphatase domain-containing protein n=1 Tax=Molorchus minor TaxID=1323400 RepID=A0ABQ9J4G8_9CUCU|nr:hypothetical protein NQ317_012656 [Molorchus minor]